MKNFRSALQQHVRRGSWPALTLALIGCFALACSSRAATLVVTNQANNGPGTLRALLPTAHNGDVITFAVTGIITNVVSCGLTISNNISIVGPGSGVLTVMATNWYRGFVV